ncbi:MAG: hypothetical protein IKX06_02450 [Clostridia bacterium]|nr:hypothetical protein [Clostridia bacterium]
MGFFDKILSSVRKNEADEYGLKAEWTQDRVVTLEKMPENLDELKAVVDVGDPGSVAAYFVYGVMCLVADHDAGMSMMKYLFADIEPFGRGFTEGGGAGRAGWDPYFDDRLKDDDYRWLPRAYFEGAEAANGFKPSLPLAIRLHYNEPNTKTINSQSFKQLGRLNVVYWIMSNAGGNKININLSRFDGTDRWYVTSGATSSAIFYDQRGALTEEARAKLYD